MGEVHIYREGNEISYKLFKNTDVKITFTTDNTT